MSIIGKACAIAASTALVASLGACGGEAETEGAPESRTGLEDGVLNVLADGTYAPYAYLDTDGKTMLGVEPEVLDAIAEKLGVTVQYQNMQFDSMIPAISNRRADMMIMSMADTAERRKQVDFIDLYRSTMRVTTLSGNPGTVDLGDDPENLDLMGLCGHSAAVTTSGQQEATLKLISEDCIAADLEPVEVLPFTEYSQEILAVKNGRVDFNLMTPAVAEYFLRSNPDMEALPGSFPQEGARFTGWILAKENDDLQGQVLTAIDELIADGTWTQVMSQWGLAESDLVLPPTQNEQDRQE